MQNISMQQSILDNLLGWWYRIAAPPNVPNDAPLHERESVRIGKLTSATLLFELIYITIVIGVGLTSNLALLPILISNYAGIIVAVLFNRYRLTRQLASILAFLVLEVGMIVNIILVAQRGGASSFNLPLFDILVQPELIAVSLFSAWVVFPVAAFNCIVIVMCINLLPKAPEYAHMLATASYNAYERPIALQIITALVTYLWVSTAVRGMRRADLAEEANKLAQDLATQQKTEMERKRLLESSIEQIVNTHTQVANGNFEARVPLDERNVLWTVAGSLNNLLARVQNWRQEAARLRATEQAIQQLIMEVQIAKRQKKPLRMSATGTMLDQLVTELTTK